MLRSLLIGLVTIGVVTLAPASAWAQPAAGSREVHPEWGHTAGHDSRIHQGCRDYKYDYFLTPPEGYWALETFLVGPDGQRYGSGYFDVGADPTTGQGVFRLCKRSLEAGRYTIQAMLSVNDDQGETDSGWLPDSTFRLRQKRR